MVICRKCKFDTNSKVQAHCSICCETFTTVTNFDKHRARGKNSCVNPSRRGLVQNEQGIWYVPDTGVPWYSTQRDTSVADDPLPDPES